MDYKYDRVLIVNDQLTGQSVLKNIIEGTGFCRKIYFHSSISSALDFFSNMAKADMPMSAYPQLVVLELNNPVVMGADLLRRFSVMRDEWIQHCKFVIVISDKGEEAVLNRIFPGIRYLYPPLDKKSLDEI